MREQRRKEDGGDRGATPLFGANGPLIVLCVVILVVHTPTFGSEFMPGLGNWLARQTVNLIPSGCVGSNPTSGTCRELNRRVGIISLGG